MHSSKWYRVASLICKPTSEVFCQSDDDEYLHQARVALRRLRSAFSVFGPRPSARGL
jgi:CHAD domain-containing protein